MLDLRPHFGCCYSCYANFELQGLGDRNFCIEWVLRDERTVYVCMQVAARIGDRVLLGAIWGILISRHGRGSVREIQI